MVVGSGRGGYIERHEGSADAQDVFNCALSTPLTVDVYRDQTGLSFWRVLSLDASLAALRARYTYI